MYVTTVLLATAGTSAFGQPGTNGGYGLSSCFPLISSGNTHGSFNMLNVAPFRFIYGSNTTTHPDFVQFEYYDKNGLYIVPMYGESGLTDGLFMRTYHPNIGDLVTLKTFEPINEVWISNTNQFTIPIDVRTMVIKTYSWTGQGSERTLEPNNNNITLTFVEIGDAFTLSPWDASDDCMTFSNGAARLNTVLDGFCGRIINTKLSSPNPNPNEYWGSNFSLDVEFGHDPNFNGAVSSSDWCAQCDGVQAPYNFPNPIPCGCVTFELEAKMTPCPTAPEWCEDISIQIPYNICCTCDTRELPPND